MLPGNAKRRRLDLDSRFEALAAFAEDARPQPHGDGRDVARRRHGGRRVPVRPGGASRRLRPQARPCSNPLPEGLIRDFASRVDRLAVVEELDPYLTSRLQAMGLRRRGAGAAAVGGVHAARDRRGVRRARRRRRASRSTTCRRVRPMLCPGCPHRGVFYALRKMGAAVMGDIGCYTLGALPPLSAMDTCVCMGASIGMAHGMELAGGAGDRPVVAVIGDSTFAHSGLTGLMNVVYNGGDTTTVVLDNRITAMTGHQDNPFTGRTLMGEPAPGHRHRAAVCTALGVEHVAVVDPIQPAEDRARAARGARARRDRASSSRAGRARCSVTSDRPPMAVDAETCTACGLCIELGCPALSKDDASGEGRHRRRAVRRLRAVRGGLPLRAIRVGRLARASLEGALVSDDVGPAGRRRRSRDDPRRRRAREGGRGVGLDVKLSEVHGMSQRGGSVDTMVRFGDEVYSPVISRGRRRPPRRVRGRSRPRAGCRT